MRIFADKENKKMKNPLTKSIIALASIIAFAIIGMTVISCQNKENATHKFDKFLGLWNITHAKKVYMLDGEVLNSMTEKTDYYFTDIILSLEESLYDPTSNIAMGNAILWVGFEENNTTFIIKPKESSYIIQFESKMNLNKESFGPKIEEEFEIIKATKSELVLYNKRLINMKGFDCYAETTLYLSK